MITALLAIAAASPITLVHQARLLDTSGDAVEGSATIVLTLHADESTPVVAWSRSYTDVPVQAGYVSLLMSDGSPTLDSDLFASGGPLWLQTTVNGSALGDRTPLTFVPYAASSASVNGPVYATEVQVGGQVIIDTDGHVHGRGPTDLVCSANEAPVHNGTDWVCGANTVTDAQIRAAVETGPVDLPANATLGGQSLGRSINVRTIVTKSAADAQCTGSAIHVPWAYRGQTGSQICAANVRGLTTCTGVKYMYVTNGNGSGPYSPDNMSCDAAVNYPWPWGVEYGSPNTLSSEWGHGTTWVVCCQ